MWNVGEECLLWNVGKRSNCWTLENKCGSNVVVGDQLESGSQNIEHWSDHGTLVEQGLHGA